MENLHHALSLRASAPFNSAAPRRPPCPISGIGAVNGGICLILRQQPYLTAFQRQALDRRLVIDQSHHNLTVLRSGLAVNHHQVAGQDACVQHGLAPDPQGKILPGPTGVSKVK